MDGWTIVAALCAACAVWLALGNGSLRRLSGPRESRRAPARLMAWVRGQLTTRAAERRDRAIRDGVPPVCDLLAVCVEAGRPPRAALRLVAEASEEPTRAVLLGAWNQIDLGVDEVHAWASLGEQPGYRGVARDLARSVHSGIALADLLRVHAREARAEVDAASRARARQVSVAAVVPLMACFLPAFLLVGVVPIFGGLVGKLFGS